MRKVAVIQREIQNIGLFSKERALWFIMSPHAENNLFIMKIQYGSEPIWTRYDSSLACLIKELSKPRTASCGCCAHMAERMRRYKLQTREHRESKTEGEKGVL